MKNISKKQLPNSRRYVYYNFHRTPKYVYIVDNAPDQESMSKPALIFILLILISFIFAILYVSRITMPPKKLDILPKYENVHILDYASVFKAPEEIESSLESFQNLTGICPYIITVHNSDWKKKWSLDEYTNSLYVEKFQDQQHFLIVYSDPDDASSSEFDTWESEEVHGKDTDRILNSDSMYIFNTDLRNSLADGSVTTDNAFIKTFDHSQKYLMSSDSDIIIHIAATLLFVIALIFAILLVIKYYITSQRKYYPAPEDEQCLIDVKK